MLRLIGEYVCSMDTKNRVRLPSQLIKQLGVRDNYAFVLACGLDNHLTLYPIEIWDKKAEKLAQLNEYEPEARMLARKMYRGMTLLEADEQSRILISKRLMDYAGIEKEVILYAYNEIIEIWAAEAFENMMNIASPTTSELAQKYLGNKI